MFKQVMISLLVGISVVAILGTEAAAQRCTGGSCYSKGVLCEDISGNGVGNVTKDPKSISIVIEPIGDPLPPLLGFALCANQGGNKPPGLQPAEFFGDFATITPITPGKVDRNGNFTGVDVLAMLTPNQLATLIGACPNENYIVTDFVPIGPFQITFELVDGAGEVLATDVMICELPNPETLKISKNTGLPERRQYACFRP
jgi:hypothetical protein